MFFSRHRRLQTQLYLAYLGIILFSPGTFSIFFYVFVSGKLKDEAFERLYNNNLSLKDSVEANIEDMDNVSININYSSIVENTLSYDFNLNQNRDSYKRLADLFVMLNGTNSRADYIYLYDLEGNCLQVDSVQKLTQVDLKAQAWYESVMSQKGALFLSAPYEKKISAYTTDVISLYRTYVNSRHKTVGIVETVKNCKSLFNSIIRFEKKTTTPTRIYIYNDRKELIYPYHSDLEIPDYPSLSKSSTGNSFNGTKVEKAINPVTSQKEYLTSLHSQYTGWIYYAVQDEADILSPLNDLTRVLLIFVVIMILIASIVSHYLAKRLAHPIAHLKHIIQRMQLSNLGSESPASYPVFSVELKELYDSFSEMNQKLKTSRDQLLKVQEAELEARSLALQSQMSPHFYYNSLSSIMILAENGDTKSVAGMCQNLSRIMRYVTDFKTRIVTIREELDYIKEYLYCMKMRNQSSLQYEILVDDSLLDITLPKLCIHPLVENALKYGTNCSPPWTVKIYSIIQENFWKICVEDTGPGFSEETLNHLKAQIETFALDSSEIPKLQINGLGLANIYIRMSIYFEQNFIFEYGNTKEGHAFTAIGAFCRKEN